MKMMKKTKLAAALAATIGLGAFTGSAQAVNMAPDGVGELLYFPYYIVGDSQENHIQLINTSNKTVAVKLMFREGEGSEDVRDFHIIMSPRDVWNGFVRHDGSDNAKVVTSDRTCTVPDKPRWNSEGGETFSIPFSTRNFAGEELKPREGYALALVMGVSDISTNTVNSVPFLAKHVENADGQWIPRDCAAIDWAFGDFSVDEEGDVEEGAGFRSILSQFGEPMNVLAGSSVLVNTLGAKAVNVPVTALANFRNILGGNIIRPSGFTTPNESFVFPKEAVVFDDQEARLYEASFNPDHAAGAAAVTAALMRDSVIGQFDTTEVRTNWVINFPTKRFHLRQTGGVDTPFPPFKPAQDEDGNNIVVDEVEISPIAETLLTGDNFSSFNNFEESEGIIPTSTNFSPAVPIAEEDVFLPWEVNVITFDGRNLMNSNLTTNLNLSQPEGWMQMRFTNSRTLIGTGPDGFDVDFHGLPVIGFNFTEETIDGVTAGVSFAYTRNIVD